MTGAGLALGITVVQPPPPAILAPHGEEHDYAKEEEQRDQPVLEHPTPSAHGATPSVAIANPRPTIVHPWEVLGNEAPGPSLIPRYPLQHTPASAGRSDC